MESQVRTSEEIDKLAAALAKAQGAYVNPTRDRKNPHFGSMYADLSSVIDAIRAATSANGIATTQVPRILGDSLILVTRLTHESGQWMEGDWPLGKTTQTPQQLGSALTYARRYSLSAITNIAADDDDDGNSAAPKGGKTSEKAAATRPALMTPEESAEALSGLLPTLAACASREAIVKWSNDVSATKDRLAPEDQAKLKEAFLAKQKAVKAGAAQAEQKAA